MIKTLSKLLQQTATYSNYLSITTRTVRHSFNTTDMANYRVQLAVPPSTNNHNNIVFKKVNKQVH